MSSLELFVSIGVAGDPSDVGNADDVAVQVCFENTGAASWAASARPLSGLLVYIWPGIRGISSGLDLGGLLQVLSMGVHLSQHSADPVVLHAQLLNPLLVVGTGLVRNRHVLELSFLGEVDVIHGAFSAGWPAHVSRNCVALRFQPIGVYRLF